MNTKLMHQTSNDIATDTRVKMIEVLNQQLADAFDLYSQTKQAHWNVKGIHFIALHKLFDQLAAGLLEHVDMIAERVTALGGVALGTARMSAQASRLQEMPEDLVSGEEFLSALVERYADYSSTARAGIDISSDAGDEVTADLLTEVARSNDKNLYFLESHIQG